MKLLAITLGDPCGIGPEVVIKSLSDPAVQKAASYVLIGPSSAIKKSKFRLNKISSLKEFIDKKNIINLIEPSCPYGQHFKMGQPDKISGRWSAESVRLSMELALNQKVAGIVHAPISKFAWKKAGVEYPGHTEWLADFCHVQGYAMAIASEHLRTVLVTRHIPFNQISKKLKPSDIQRTIECAYEWLKSCGFSFPRLGVCALNPHAGEGGLIGKEEISLLQPCIHAMKKSFRGKLIGPLPADSAYHKLKVKELDGLVTLYHDQSLIPLKLYNAEKLINVTLGLPFPRTSPGHGTAFDIAGKNKANPQSMKSAILECSLMTSRLPHPLKFV